MQASALLCNGSRGAPDTVSCDASLPALVLPFGQGQPIVGRLDHAEVFGVVDVIQDVSEVFLNFCEEVLKRPALGFWVRKNR